MVLPRYLGALESLRITGHRLRVTDGERETRTGGIRALASSDRRLQLVELDDLMDAG